MTLTPSEVAERVSILKRFKELLVEQRDRFCSYLDVLDKQKALITQGSEDDLIIHIEMQEKIVADIFSVQKCIEPMRSLYETAWLQHAAPDIPELNAALDSLKMEAARRITENKELLQSKMGVLHTELKNMRANSFKRTRRSVFADTAQPSLLDIKG